MWTASRMIRICSIDRRADHKQRSRSFEQKIIFILLYALFWVIPRRLNYSEESMQHSEHGESMK
jgi:hypothetical protein